MKKVSTLTGTIIIIAAAIVLLGGIFAYQYFALQKINNILQPTVTGSGQNFLFNIDGKNINIKNASTGNLIQKIPLDSDVMHYVNSLQIKDIAYLGDDINFDGYKDLAVLSEVPADNPGFYDYFIYNPSTKKFEPDAVLKNLCNPSFNPTAKTITTQMSEGCVGENFGEQTFSFINGHYALTQTKEGNCCTMQDAGGKQSVTVNNFDNAKIVSTTQEACPPQQ